MQTFSDPLPQLLHLDAEAIARLRAEISGAVVTPADDGYDHACAAWNLNTVQRPAIIVQAQVSGDVASAVRFARTHRLAVAVQATGHGVQLPADDCMLIVTAAMNGVAVDPQRRTAYVEAGAKWGAVLAQAQIHGLAPLLGSSPGVGAVGYTLGGGLGWLGRAYGLSADNVVDFDVVTAAGDRLHVSADEHPDLFWALRGGGGAFAIVTGMTIQLHPIGTVFAGNLIYPITCAAEVMTRYRAWVEDAPDALTSSVVLMHFPPIPEVPEPLRGGSFVIVRGCYAGAVAEGERLLAHWLSWRAPLFNSWQAMPFSNAAAISNDPADPLPGNNTGVYLRELSDSAIAELVARNQSGPDAPAFVFCEVRHMGGAIARGPRVANAFGHRNARFVLNVVGVTPSAEAQRAFHRQAAALKQALAEVADGVYMNFLDGDEARARIAEAYPAATLARLRQIKRAYDPNALFSHAFSIKPA